MVKFYVEYHKRDSDMAIVEKDTMTRYCRVQSQDANRTTEVLEACPRVEYYVKDREGNTVAVFFLMYTLDMHHGNVAMFCADWVTPMHRGDMELHRLRMWYLRRFCSTYGLKKYQRSKHLSDSVQVQITKEV